MELVYEYLKEKYEYKFWISDGKDIFNIVHQGITMEDFPVYLDYFKTKIVMLTDHYKEIEHHAEGWRFKHPKIIRENAFGETEAFETNWAGSVPKSAKDDGKYSTLECIARRIID